MVDFVIISYPRTGSTYFVKILNNCQNITCHSEIFHKKFEPFTRSFLDIKNIPTLFGKEPTSPSLLLYIIRELFPFKFLDLVKNKALDKLGFKIFPSQKDRILKYLVKDKKIKKIFLTRENLFKSYISFKLAIATGQWDYSPINKTKIIKVNYADFQKYYQKHISIFKSFQHYLNNDKQSFLELSYEQITKQFPILELEDFLGLTLENISLNTNQKKQNTYPLERRISNYEEIAEKLKKDGLSHFLN